MDHGTPLLARSAPGLVWTRQNVHSGQRGRLTQEEGTPRQARAQLMTQNDK